MLISPTEAIRRYDVSKPTLYSDMKDGKLSFQLDDRKKRKIDVAELDRIYDKRPQSDAEESVKERKAETVSDVKANELQILLKELELLKREVENKDDEIERWQNAFEKAQSTADKITALLEDQRSDKGDSAWQKSLKALETRIANQERSAKEDKEKRERILQQNQQLKRALNAEKNKTFWQKLFG